MVSLLERARADGVMANGTAADRETRDLLAGGIEPGHPSLYPAPERSDDTQADAT
jgi:hypothetical protein